MTSLRTFTATLFIFATMTGAAGNALRTAPDFTIRDINSRQVSMKTMTDSGAVIVTFWATWCVPCATELKHIAKLHEEFADSGLQVLAVAIDGAAAVTRVKQTAKSNKWTFSVVSDRNDMIKNAFGVVDVPTLFIVAKGGRIAYTHSGYSPGDEKKLREQVLKLIAAPVAP